MDAVERLNRFKEEFKIRERKHELYSGKQHKSRQCQEGDVACGLVCTRRFEEAVLN